MAALETAAERLERKIHAAKLGTAAQNPFAMFAHGRPSLQRRPLSESQRKEAGSMDDIVSDFGFLTVNATSRDFSGFSETMSFARMLKAISIKEVLPVITDENLPTRYSISHLVEHYFENFHVLLPFFSETDFMSSLSRIYQEMPNAAIVTPFDMWSFRLVLAISSAALCQTRGDENYNAAVYNVSVAMNIAEHVLHPGSITGIQALLLLVQYALVDPENFDSWYLIGMASRLLVDLGLHSEPARETKISKHTLDLRRRIFYCTYALDRLVSMSLGLAFSFTDDSAPNVLLPTLATDQEARSPTQLFIRSVRPSLFLFDIRRVQSSFYQKTRWSGRTEWTTEVAHGYISTALEDVQAWQTSLPPNFSQKHLQMFFIESLYSQALVLSPNQVVPMTSLSDTQKVAFCRCAIQYAEQLCSVVQNLEYRSSLCYADCCRAKYVSRQFQNMMCANFDLLIRTDSNGSSPASTATIVENCNRALGFLSNMSQILEWPMQRWGISALKEIFDQECAVLLARLQTHQSEYTPNETNLSPLSMANQQMAASSSPQAQTFPLPSLSTSPQFNSVPVQPFDANAHPFSAFPSNATSLFSDPAAQRGNLMRASSWSPNADPSNAELPAGTLPRRGYVFTGGQG